MNTSNLLNCYLLLKFILKTLPKENVFCKYVLNMFFKVLCPGSLENRVAGLIALQQIDRIDLQNNKK